MTHIFSLLFSGKLCAENNSPDRCYFSFILYFFGCGHHCYDCCVSDTTLISVVATTTTAAAAAVVCLYYYFYYWFNFAKKKERKIKIYRTNTKAMHSLVLCTFS